MIMIMIMRSNMPVHKKIPSRPCLHS
jgi:hypothetical protein